MTESATVAPALAEAVERAYHAFDDVSRPRQIDVSPVKDAADFASLGALQLRSIPDDDIGRYAGSALWTVGSEEDYHYFIPRILELAVYAPYGIGTDPTVMARKLDLAGWRAWPATQRAAIVEVFELAQALSAHEDNEEWGAALVTLKEPRALGEPGYGPKKRVLFVCSRNRLRSPTAEQVFAERPDLDVASAGTNNDADTSLTPELVAWADIIFVMEKVHRTKIQQRFRVPLGTTRIVCLDVPDRYRFMEPSLVQLLERKISRFLPLPKPG